MSYLGSWKIDDLLTFCANTQVFATGVATDADAAPAYRIYEDETGTPLLTGTFALLDGANTAGFYSEQVTLSAANGFEKGKCYSIFKSATVSGVAGAVHDTFQIEAEVDANSVSNIGANVVNASALAADAVTEIQSGLATSAALITVQADTDDIQTRLPAALVGGRMDSSVGAMAANTLTASALATDAVTEIWAKAMVELSGVPGATGSVLEALTFLFMAIRNARATTATADVITNDAGGTIATAVLSDNGTTFSKGKYA